MSESSLFLYIDYFEADEWQSGYIFVNKTYELSLQLQSGDDDGNKKKSKRKSKNSKGEYRLAIDCIDENGESLEGTEFEIQPLLMKSVLVSQDYTVSVTLKKLSFEHANSEFRLRFNVIPLRNTKDDSEFTFESMAVRTVNYKLVIEQSPPQLIEQDWKFYKDVRPKTNYLRYQIALKNSRMETVKPPRTVPIQCKLYFSNGELTPKQELLKVEGVKLFIFVCVICIVPFFFCVHSLF